MGQSAEQIQYVQASHFLWFNFLFSACYFSVCHAEVNAAIAGFRREADLSACTLYVTLSPCPECSKLVAQSGIKNVIYAKYYKGGQHMADILERLPDMNIT